MQQIKNIKKDIDFLAVLATIVFLIFTLLAPSVKVFFVLAFIYFTFLSSRFSFGKAVIYSGIILNYFSIGQSHSILVIPEKALFVNQYIGGRFISWTISPALIICVVAAILFGFWQKKLKHKFSLLIHEKIIVIIFGWGILAAIYGSLMPALSLYYVLTSFLGMIWITYLISFGQNFDQKNWRRILFTILSMILLLIFYEGLIVFLQMLYRSPLGLLVESMQMAPTFGLGADELGGGFRPFGVSFHPNGLANRQFLLTAATLLLWTYLVNKNSPSKPWKNIVVFAATIATISIVLSLSRAVYFATTVAIFIVHWRHKILIQTWWKNIIKNLKNIKLRHKLVLIILVLILTSRLTNRLLNTIYSFSEFGGINTRSIQYQEAWQVFRQSPIFGIGDGMFIPTSYQLFPQGVMTYFPENVHNGFLLFITERGLPSLGLYLLFLYFFYKQNQFISLKKTTQTMLYSAIIGGFIIMLLHPERNLFSTPILLGIAIIHYESYQKKHS